MPLHRSIVVDSTELPENSFAASSWRLLTPCGLARIPEHTKFHDQLLRAPPLSPTPILPSPPPPPPHRPAPGAPPPPPAGPPSPTSDRGQVSRSTQCCGEMTHNCGDSDEVEEVTCAKLVDAFPVLTSPMDQEAPPHSARPVVQHVSEGVYASSGHGIFLTRRVGGERRAQRARSRFKLGRWRKGWVGGGSSMVHTSESRTRCILAHALSGSALEAISGAHLDETRRNLDIAMQRSSFFRYQGAQASTGLWWSGQ